MPIILPTEFEGLIEQPHADSPYVWLWELVLDAPLTNPPSAPTWARLTSYDEDVSWPPGEGAKTWYSMSLEHSEIEQSGEGNLPSLSLLIDNTGRWLMPYLETFDLDGNRATLFLINQKYVGSAQAFIKWEFEIAGASANRSQVELKLADPNNLERRLPEDRYNAVRCRWTEFGGPECGYIINSAAAHASCDRTLAACVERGEDELARGLPVIHPKRFGGFAAIPVQRLTA